LLPSTSAFSTYVLDSISLYCGADDYRSFCNTRDSFDDFAVMQRTEVTAEIDQLTEYTLSSISRKSLTDFIFTIPRKDLGDRLDEFVGSPHTIYPVIAPGGFGKSIALAHWVMGQKSERICLFSPASLFISLLDPGIQRNKALKFNPGSSGSVFDIFLDDTRLDDGKVLLVIDALDELSTDPEKLHALVDFMFDVAERYSHQNRVKMVFSARESVWQTYLSSRFEQVKSKNWFGHIDSVLESGYSNLFTLSNSEIREIIRNINREEDTPLIYGCIPWNIRELIRIPINLHYISVLFRKKATLEHITQNAVIREFMKETVFQSRYAEQKEDLLWKVLELIEEKEEGILVSKSELKKHYPFHLKREKAYYVAYNDLLENGLFLENREENKYGIYVTQIGFKHLNFYYYLQALYKIRENNGLDYSLIKSVAGTSKKKLEASNMLAIFYQIAYENEDFETLEHFCDLPDSLLGSLPVRMAVGASFREVNAIRDPIIRKYAAHESGRAFFFERFVDTNYLFNNFAFRIEAYLKHVQEDESVLFGNCILYLKAFLGMNREDCEGYFSIINRVPASETIYPWPIGRKASAQILHTYFIHKGEIADLDGLIQRYTRVAYAYPGYLTKGLVEFELYIMIALVLIQEFEVLDRLLTNIFSYYNTSNSEFAFPAMQGNIQNTIPQYFLEYAIYKQGRFQDHTELPDLWEQAIDSLAPTFDDYQYLIIFNWFLCDYYTTEGSNSEKALEYYNAALELSRYARYDFYSAFLMKNDPAQKPEHLELADRMIAASGFNSELFSYQFGPLNDH
jgi:hypothetical protein